MTKIPVTDKLKYGFKVKGRTYLVDIEEVSLINPRIDFNLFKVVVSDLLNDIDDLQIRVRILEESTGLDEDK